MYLYTCWICRESIKGRTENDVVKTAKHHYANRHTADKNGSEGRRYCEEDILERIEKLDKEV